MIEASIIVYKSLSYINDHLKETLTAKDIANASGYSQYHFARVFKSYMNVSLIDYVTKRKLMKASEEILAGEKIIDVAFKYGWQTHSGFTKAFKKEYGFYPAFLRAMKVQMESQGGSTMIHIFLKPTDENATKEQLFDMLKESILENKIEAETKMLEAVYQCSCRYYGDLKRYSGNEYITHPLNVAIILTELNAEFPVICAGMLCDVREKNKITEKEIKKDIPKAISDIVNQLPLFDKGLVTVFEEEVTMIKLAQRLHNMRTIEFMNKGQQKSKAKETIHLFMPLARKLGNKKLINELEDIAMNYL